MQFLENEIDTYVSMIWETMLGQSTRRLPDNQWTPTEYARASTQIIGQWKGVILMDLSLPLADKIGHTFFANENGDLPEQELLDALSEMANLFGGNIKSVLPQPSQLMLPIVSLKGDTLQFPGVRTVSQIGFDCEGDPFRVLIMEQSASRFSKNLKVH